MLADLAVEIMAELKAIKSWTIQFFLELATKNRRLRRYINVFQLLILPD